ncbi:MAG TPA: ECF transporter S component [Erysipelothrix sp.]|nr:ECF transporter S component [Erysipelothrix sp.]
MKTKQLVFTALFMAIVFVLGLWPQLGFIQLGPFVQVTIIHVPVIIGAIFLGPQSGVLIGLAFGIGSFINSMSSAVIFAPVFANPLVSVLPRMIFGWSVYYIYAFFKRLFKNKKTLGYGMAAGVSTLFHALMVVPLLFFFGMGQSGVAAYLTDSFGASIINFIGAIFVANTLMEVAVAVIIAPIILGALNRIQP